MVIVHRRKGEQIQVGRGLAVTILEIDAGRVKMACSLVASGPLGVPATVGRPAIRTRGWYYYRFQQGGRCTQVVTPSKGSILHVNGTHTLVVLDIQETGVQLGICRSQPPGRV